MGPARSSNGSAPAAAGKGSSVQLKAFAVALQSALIQLIAVRTASARNTSHSAVVISGHDRKEELQVRLHTSRHVRAKGASCEGAGGPGTPCIPPEPCPLCPRGSASEVLYCCDVRSAEPIQQWTQELEPGKEVECLIDRLKAHFAATGPAKSAAQRQRQQVRRAAAALLAGGCQAECG